MRPESLIPAEDLPTAEAISRLSYCNPFPTERLKFEEQVLGNEFTPFFRAWHPRADMEDDNPNVVKIAERASSLTKKLLDRLNAGAAPTRNEKTLYQDVCNYALYYRYQEHFFEMTLDPEASRGGRDAPFFSEFKKDYRRLFGNAAVHLPPSQTPEHLFSCFFQIRRAFHFIFRSIAGSSMPTARFRARVWQSVFTHDMRRYQRVMFDKMGLVTTLITGPSGAGKELVARAIGYSRYIPFDPNSKSFRESYEESFYPLNLPALSPTLIESELFGYRKGAFTGADTDRKGRLEVCPPLGTVFLDEIGDVDAAIQVKLLRVLETRTFQPLGTTEDRPFRGKVVAATNRNLEQEMQAGRFRSDLYFRLCADTIEAPSLQERIADEHDELSTLILILTQRLVGPEEAPQVSREVEAWIEENLGPDYAWPGNVRELSQCVSNVLIHSDYEPVTSRTKETWREKFTQQILNGELTADELMRAYCTLVYSKKGSYLDAAEHLGLDRRTVKSRVDPEILEELGRG